VDQMPGACRFDLVGCAAASIVGRAFGWPSHADELRIDNGVAQEAELFGACGVSAMTSVQLLVRCQERCMQLIGCSTIYIW
jgi:hypothetical protein